MNNRTDSPRVRRVDAAIKITSAAIGCNYVLGLIITHIYLAHSGIFDFSMIKIQYVLTGFSFLVYTFSPLLLVLTVLVIARRIRQLFAGSFLLGLACVTIPSYILGSITFILGLMFVDHYEFSRLWMVWGRYIFNDSGEFNHWAWSNLVILTYLPILYLIYARFFATKPRSPIREKFIYAFLGIGLLSAIICFSSDQFYFMSPAFGGGYYGRYKIVLTKQAKEAIQVIYPPPEDNTWELKNIDCVMIHETRDFIYVFGPPGGKYQVNLEDESYLIRIKKSEVILLTRPLR